MTATGREGQGDHMAGRWYALALLTMTYAMSTVDRSMLAIVAERVKVDIGASDAEIGLLYGTAFAIFYVLFGIPMGKLADAWSRRKLLSTTMVGWSLFTAASGLARNFVQLLGARIGVGVGEAAVTPASHAMLSDFFPGGRRGFALAVYSCGAPLGTGIALLLGAAVMGYWDKLLAQGETPLGLASWQAAMIAAGIPGLLLAILVARMPQPPLSEQRKTSSDVGALAVVGREVASIIPIVSLFMLLRSHPRPGAALMRNQLLLAGLLAAGILLAMLTGDRLQWIILGTGLYATLTWAQIEASQDDRFARLFLQRGLLLFALLGFGCFAFGALSFHSWWISFFARFHPDAGNIGPLLGILFMVFGVVGMLFGGFLGDRWKRRSRYGYLYTCLLSGSLSVPFIALALYAPSTPLALVLVSIAILALTMWLPPAAAVMQEQVGADMRGLSAGLYMLVSNFLGNGVGPYSVGRISDATGDLRFALALCCCAGFALGIVLLALALSANRARADSVVAQAS